MSNEPPADVRVFEGVVDDADYYHTILRKGDGGEFYMVVQSCVGGLEGKRVRIIIEVLE